MTKGSDVSFSFDSKQAVSLDEVLRYENPALLRRLISKEQMSESDARQAVGDTLRFLYLCATSETLLAPSKRIDTVWHHFILFTRFYADFCETYLGKFIHHTPKEAYEVIAAEDQSPCSSCRDCSDCGGGGTGRDLPSSPENITAEKTFEIASNRFGALSPNWR